MDDPRLDSELIEKKETKEFEPISDPQHNDDTVKIYFSESRISFRSNQYSIFKKEEKNSQSFVVIPSLNKPRWILDTNFIKCSSTLNPSTHKARFVLFIFKKLWSIGLQRIIFPARIHICNSKDIVSLINGLVEIEEYIGSFYIGSIGPLQKYTIEIAQKNICTGYIKIAPTIAAKLQIKSEVKALAFMRSKNIENVELPVHSEVHSLSKVNAHTAFRQSPVSAKEVPVGMSSEIINFLRNVTRKTVHSKKEEQEFYFDALSAKLLKVNSLLRSLLNLDSIEISKKLNILGESENPFYMAFSHGDFTRWNTRISDASLSVFDWEEGEFRPFSHDFFHFIFSEHVLVGQRTDFREFYQTSKQLFSTLWHDDLFDFKPCFKMYLYFYFLWLSIYYLELILIDESDVFMNDKSNKKVISFIKNSAKYFSKEYSLSLTKEN